MVVGLLNILGYKCGTSCVPVYLLPGVEFVLNIKDINGHKFFCLFFCFIVLSLTN